MPENISEIGKIIAVDGEAFAESSNGLRPLEVGSSVFEGEELVTGIGSNLEVRFVDDTLLSQGGDSRISLDDYAFDAQGEASEYFVNIAQGTFRMVTGKIAEQNPERFKVGSPLATIGIRGTITLHEVQPGRGEKHGVEEIHSGKALLVQSIDGQITQIARPQAIVDISSSGMMSPIRTLSTQELNSFREIAPASIRQEQEIRQERQEEEEEEEARNSEEETTDESSESDGEENTEGEETAEGEGAEGAEGEGVEGAEGEGAETAEGEGVEGAEGEGAETAEGDDGEEIAAAQVEGGEAAEGENFDGGDAQEEVAGAGSDAGNADPENAQLAELDQSPQGGGDGNQGELPGSEPGDRQPLGDDVNPGGGDIGSPGVLSSDKGVVSTVGKGALVDKDEFDDSRVKGEHDKIGDENKPDNDDDAHNVKDSDNDDSEGEGGEGEDGGDGSGDTLLETGVTGGTAQPGAVTPGTKPADGGEQEKPAETDDDLDEEEPDTDGGNPGTGTGDGDSGDGDGDGDSGDSGGDSGDGDGDSGDGDGDSGDGDGDSGAGDGDSGDGDGDSGAGDGDSGDGDGDSGDGDSSSHVITGTPADDILTGTSEADTINGLCGNDSINGGAGNDSIYGGNGDDRIMSGKGSNYIDGGDGYRDGISYQESSQGINLSSESGTVVHGGGTDTITNVEGYVGSVWDDTLTGKDGDEYFEGGKGNDVIDGGGTPPNSGGSSTGGGGGVVVGGTYNSSTSHSVSNSDWDIVSYQNADGAVQVDLKAGTATGADGNDTLINIEEVIGSDYNDTLIGNDTDNLIEGRTGDDEIDGGNAYDTLSYQNAAGAVQVDISAGTATGADGNDTFINIEAAEGSEFGDVLIGNSFENEFRGRGGDDTIDGGDGFDRVDYKHATGGVYVNLAEGTATGGDGNDKLISIEHVEASQNFNDTIIGNSGYNRFMDRGLTNDTYDGGEGTDHISYRKAESGVVVDLEEGTTSGGAGEDQLISIENVEGSKFGDTLTGGSGIPDSPYSSTGLYGGDGDDFLYGGSAQSNFLEGGDGNDTLTSGEGEYNNLRGGSGDDTLIAGGQAHLIGGQGEDTLISGSGKDTYQYSELNEGGDQIKGFDSSTDYFNFASYAFGEAADFKVVSAGYDGSNGSVGTETPVFIFDSENRQLWYDSNGDEAGGNTLIATLEESDSVQKDNILIDSSPLINPGPSTLMGTESSDNIRGTSYDNTIYGLENNDYLYGLAGNDALYGGAGYDSLSGGAGDDLLDGGDGYDTVSYWDSESGVYVNLETGTATGEDGNDTLVSIEHVSGTSHNDTLIGDSGSNIIRGEMGDDSIDGGAGEDTIEYGFSMDSGVKVDLAAGTATGAFGNDTFINIESVNTHAQDDTLIGNEGNNMLNAGSGNNSVSGAGGNDIILVGDGDDYIDGGDGADTLAYWSASSGVAVDLTNGTAIGGSGNDTFTNIENVQGSGEKDAIMGSDTVNYLYGGGGNDDIYGYGGNDFISGEVGNDYLYGGSGVDNIFGGAGDDTLVGGDDVDFLYGGEGKDVFVYKTLTNVTDPDEVIGDFNNVDDKIDFSGTFYSSSAAFINYTGTGNYSGEGAGLGGGAGFVYDSLGSLWYDENGDESGGLHHIAKVGGVTQSNITVDGEALNTSGVTHTGTDSGETLLGTIADDILNGVGGNDVIHGYAGNDSIYGGDGDDTISVGDGTDGVNAGAGNDYVLSGKGSNYLNGGDGTLDVLSYASSSSGVTVDVAAEKATHDGGSGVDTFSNFEVYEGSEHADSFTGDTNFIYYFGSTGDDTYDVGDRVVISYENIDGAVQIDLAAGTMTGAAGSDTLSYMRYVFGTDYGDVITGYNELDDDWRSYLGGGKGDDTLTGGQGDADRILYNNADGGVTVSLSDGTSTGADGNDIFTGFEGIQGSMYDDHLIGDYNDNTLKGNAGDDTIDGGYGDDRVSYWESSTGVYINLELGTVTGGEGNDTLISIEEAFGSGHGDTLIGDAGYNYFDAGAGDDTIFVTEGGDRYLGGEGKDTFIVSTMNATYTAGNDLRDFSAEDDRLELKGSAGYDVNAGFAKFDGYYDQTGNLASLGASARFVFDDAGNLWYDDNGDATGGIHYVAHVGTDELGASNITVDGEFIKGSGTPLRGTSADETISGDSDSNTIYGMGGNDTLYGEAGNDSLFGGEGDDSVSGGDGDDYIFGDVGNDYLDGGAGTDDRLTYHNLDSGVVIDVAEGTVSIGSDIDTITGFEAYRGSGGDDTITGSSANELFGASLGDDTIDGGGGIDGIDFNMRTITEAVQVDLAAGTATGDFGSVTIANIENVEGTEYGDTIIGDVQANTLDGGKGDDTLLGCAGDDVLLGGDDDDIIDGGAGSNTLVGGSGRYDLVSYESSESGIVMDVGAGTVVNGGGTDIISGFEGYKGSDYADDMTGSSEMDRFFATAGDDTIDGGDNTDTVSYENSTDGVQANLADGTAISSLGNDTLTNIEKIIGTEHIDLIIGDAQRNTINGGDGDDILNGGDGEDTIDYYGSSGSVSVDLAAGTATGAAGDDTISNFEKVRGSNYDDVLTGDSSDNSFRGGKGDDTIDGGDGLDQVDYLDAERGVYVNLEQGTATGGDGNDLLISIEQVIGSHDHSDTIIGNSGDNLFVDQSGLSDTYDGNGGFDTVMFQTDSGVNVDLQYGMATGGAGSDTLMNIDRIYGSSYGDTLRGSYSVDSLIGMDGDDTIYGGEGADYLEGGSGNDIFSFGSYTEFGDTIKDFSSGDKLSFTADFASATFSYDDGTDILYCDYDGTGSVYSSEKVADFSNDALGTDVINSIEIV